MQYLDGDYDGVVIKQKDGATLAIVDNSTQIKSATDNVGTFDKSNPDIRYSYLPVDIEKTEQEAQAERAAQAQEAQEATESKRKYI